MRSITATFEIVTPMFLGGADQQASRIRESSIKGALAFWWRALNYARFVEDADGNQPKALKAMQKKEQTLFGSDKGQGVFLLKVEHGELKQLPVGEVLGKDGTSFSDCKMDDPRTIGVGARYLGYGLINSYYAKGDQQNSKPKKEAGELERSCIAAKSELNKNQLFKLTFVFSSKNQKQFVEELLPTLKIFGLIGGLGSRVRRGWGSVVLVALEPKGFDDLDKWASPSDHDGLKKRLLEIIGKIPMSVAGSDFMLTAFSLECQIYCGSKGGSKSLEVLAELGNGFLAYRAHGHPAGKLGGRTDQKTGKYIGGIDVDASFGEDHDWYYDTFKKPKNPPRLEKSNEYVPRRTAFGLPHNYNKKYGVTATGDHDRRASPLFFHVQKIGTKYYPVVLFFPTKFLPDNNAAIWTGKEDKDNKCNKNYDFEPQVITDFLEGYRHVDGVRPTNSTPPTVNPYFPSTKIFPVEDSS